MNCCKNLIGIKNLCESEETLYYLDDIGISLKTVAKGTDERYTNAKAMVERVLELAWDEVFDDALVGGKTLTNILFDDVSGYFNTDLVAVTTHTDSFEIQKRCKLAEATVGCFVLQGEGIATVQYFVDGELIKEWEDFEFDGKHYFEVQSSGLKHEIVIDGTVDLYEVDNVPNAYINNALTYTTFEFYVKCNPKVHLCKFAKTLAKAALYKAGAMMWKQLREGNRWNELIEIKREDAVAQMAWLDSTYNLLKYDPAQTETYKPKGMYQNEIKKINIPEPKYCACCLKCEGDSIVIALP
jgi:hypothetical protein